jgi:hypothetical protein
MAGRAYAAFAVALLSLVLAGCVSSDVPAKRGTPSDESMSFDQLGQTDFNRTATVAMSQNLDTLATLMEKLYKRNPAEWKKSGMPNLATALARGRKAIDVGQVPPDLVGLHDVEILSVALDPAYRGDRVRAFILGLANMIIQAHGGKTRFYVTDTLNAQHVFNAARNVETAAWLLATRRDAGGHLLLLSNALSETGSNLSFERLFGELIGRLDLIASLLDEKYRRIGINYLQGLLLFNFLPVR